MARHARMLRRPPDIITSRMRPHRNIIGMPPETRVDCRINAAHDMSIVASVTPDISDHACASLASETYPKPAMFAARVGRFTLPPACRAMGIGAAEAFIL